MSPDTARNCLYMWTSPLCSSCACICMSTFLCRYRVLIFFLYFLSSYINIFTYYIYIYYIYIHLHIYIYIYICISYMPISVYDFLYLSGTFLAHVLRPNSFHRCSSFTSHCCSFTSLLQKRFRRQAHAFYFPAYFQVQLTYFHIHVTFGFRSPPWASSRVHSVQSDTRCALSKQEGLQRTGHQAAFYTWSIL